MRRDVATAQLNLVTLTVEKRDKPLGQSDWHMQSSTERECNPLDVACFNQWP